MSTTLTRPDHLVYVERRSLGVRLLDRLRTPGGRRRCYAAVAALLFVLAVAAVSFKTSFDFVTSDGRYYYAYLSSLAVDGDLDFANQMRDHWGTDPPPPAEPPHLTPRGLAKNKFPVGVALTLAPAFLAAHAAAHAGHALTGAAWCAPDGYSPLYQIAILVSTLGLTAWGLALTDRLLTRGLGLRGEAAGLAALAAWLGTPLLYYTFREPVMAHAAGFFWVTASVYLVWRLRVGLDDARLSGWRLLLLAFTTSMALVCRPTNAFLLPFHVYLFGAVVRAGMLWRFLRLLPLALPGLVPLAAQALAWHQLYGSWLVNGYEGEGFRWARPALGQTLFSPLHGLFFWSPVLLLAAGGVAWRLARRPDGLVGCYAAAFALLWYANSSWHCWWFGDAFGGRSFVEVSGLAVLGLACVFDGARRAGPAVRLGVASLLGVTLLFQLVLMGLYILRWVPRGDYLL